MFQMTTDDLSVVMVERRGEGVDASHVDLQENKIFQGSENPFIFERFYDLNLRCRFDLIKYPFDHQYCFIDVSKACGLHYKHVTIVNDDSSLVSKWSFNLGDDPRVIINDRHMFIIQATDLFSTIYIF